MSRYDLIVVGGGLSGVAAAIAARREGATVLLLEKAGFLGGAAVNCLVNPFMPYWTHEQADGVRRRVALSRGLFSEVLTELTKLDALDGTCFHEEYLKVALERMVTREGVDVMLHADMAEADASGRRIQSIRAVAMGEMWTLEADYYIDCTGDANLAAAAGCPWHLGRDGDHLCQPMTLCFRVVNVDMEKYRQSRAAINELYQRFQREGKIKNPREDVLIFDTLVDGMLHFNSTRVVKLNPVDPLDRTRAAMLAREQMLELYGFLRQNVPGFESSRIAFSAPEIGVRESRMIDGEYILTGEDLKACARFEDAIAAGNYDIDIHNPEGSGTSHYYFPDGAYYTIPYRSLIPKGIDNLLVAGRCISSTHEAQASYRIMPICACLGQAAGVAAGVAKRADTSFRRADVNEIRSILVERGQFIG